MVCYFCHKSDHVSECCPEFQTFRQRNLLIQKSRKRNCLCDNPVVDKFQSCSCRIICPGCFQHHHIAMCPKRDPLHPINSTPLKEPFNLFKLEYLIVKRFFELCNPIDQFKLQSSCKYFKSFSSTKVKLNYRCFPENPFLKTIFNGLGFFQTKNEITILQLTPKNYYNFDSIYLDRCLINERDLKFLAKSDPHFVLLNSCILGDNVSFQDVLNAFSYAYEYIFWDEPLPQRWVTNFLNAERKVEFQKIAIQQHSLDMGLNELIKLFEQNESVSLTITVKGGFLSDVPIIKAVLSCQRFVYNLAFNGDNSDLRFRSLDGGVKILLNFIRQYS